MRLSPPSPLEIQMSFVPAPKNRMDSVAVQRQAPLSLSFLVIGAGAPPFFTISLPLSLTPISPTLVKGIGGLSCAYSLASSGHRVKILEALPKNARKSYSGLRVPPNMSKILLEWGLGKELKVKTRPCRQAVFDDRQSSICFRLTLSTLSRN